MKNILILSSSPRKGGNTDLLGDAFAKGAKEYRLGVAHRDSGREVEGRTCIAIVQDPQAEADGDGIE